LESCIGVYTYTYTYTSLRLKNIDPPKKCRVRLDAVFNIRDRQLCGTVVSGIEYIKDLSSRKNKATTPLFEYYNLV
jgi:hypothetical protein